MDLSRLRARLRKSRDAEVERLAQEAAGVKQTTGLKRLTMDVYDFCLGPISADDERRV